MVELLAGCPARIFTVCECQARRQVDPPLAYSVNGRVSSLTFSQLKTSIFSINTFDKLKQIKFLKLRISCFAKSTMIKQNFNMSTQNFKTNVIQNFSFFNMSILKLANFLFSTILMKIISQLRKNFNNFSNLQCQKNNNNIFLNISMSYFNFA